MSEKITYVAGQYFDKWQLILDGEPIRTATSYLFPVRWNNQSAMLKLATAAEEKRGAYLMSWWNGNGAARIFAQEGDALLMERAHKTPSLIAMSQQGQDDEASRLISQIADQLHQPRERSLPELVPLAVWFRDLEPAGRYYGGILAQAAAMAGELLRDPQDNTVLHGDLHHGNILYFGGRGWLLTLRDCSANEASIMRTSSVILRQSSPLRRGVCAGRCVL